MQHQGSHDNPWTKVCKYSGQSVRASFTELDY